MPRVDRPIRQVVPTSSTRRASTAGPMSNSETPRPSRQRKRSRQHRGVVLIKPEGRHGWRGRWRDPDANKLVKETLPDRDARNEDTRAAWAVRKAGEIAKRKHDLDGGAPRATGTPLGDAIEGFYKAHPRLRAKTLRGYRAATAKLLHWASRNGVRTTDDLNRAKLMGLREQLINEPKRTAAKGGKRGARVAVDVPRSPFSVNRELAALRTVLGYLSDKDLLSRIREGDLRRACKKLPVAIERIEFLQTAELTALLAAASKHDAAKFTETRTEHKSRKGIGSTPRFKTVAPIVVLLLLSGMRLGEALALEWNQIDLTAGEIRLTGATKTKRARAIDLSVSPALRDLLGKIRGAGKGRVLDFSVNEAKRATERLRALGAPPNFGWQVLRATCGTYLTNAPGIFGGASAYRSARQLGHSVAVAERHYLGLVRGIPATAKTLEAAMGIEAALTSIVVR